MSTPDKRILKTRTAIDSAFWELMERMDFSEITIHDVTALAKISRTTFYHHYTDKSDWLEQTLLGLLREEIQHVFAMELNDPVITVDLLARIFHGISRNHRVCQLIHINTDTQLLYRFFYQKFTSDYKSLGFLPPQPSQREDLTVHYIAVSVSAYVEWWVRNHHLFTPEEMARCIYAFHHLPEKEKS